MMTRRALLLAALLCWPPSIAGTVFEFRPTIHDEPFTKVNVSIFKAATSTESTMSVGEVEAIKGRPAADSKSKPNFTVAIVKIEGPPTAKSS
jgi:hypothetical protein